MLGIALGVAALIIVLSVMNGFQKEVRDRMLSAVAHMEVLDLTLDEDADGVLITSVLDEVAFSVAGHEAIFGLGRKHRKADRLGDLAVPFDAALTRLPKFDS